MKTRTKIMLGVVGGSFALHLAAWAWVGRIKGERKHDVVAIALAESKKKEEKKKEPIKPAEIKPEKAKVIQPIAKTIEPPPPVVDAPPPPANDAMNGYADLGLGTMSGGTGMGVPQGHGGAGARANAAPETTHHVTSLAPPQDACAEDLVKPKIEHQIQPAYTQEGRQANAEGFVQLELTIDASGHVVSVKVLRGLGFGLDEAAAAAAKQWTFAPATRCGKVVPTTIKGKVRFSLS